MSLIKNKYFVFITFGISLAGFLAVLFFDFFSSTNNVHGAGSSTSAHMNKMSRRMASSESPDILQKAEAADPSARATLLQWAKSEQILEREKAASYLWRYKDEESFKSLAALTKDRNTGVRARAYNGLSLSRERQSVAVLNNALKNTKLSKHEKALIQLLKSRGIKSEGLEGHIKVALEHFYLNGQGFNSLSKPLINALLLVPDGREKLKAMYEKQDLSKITKKTASLVVVGVGASCPSNRLEYFKSAMIHLKEAHHKEQIVALTELKKHGAKGAELLGAYVGKEAKLPDSFKVSVKGYISQKKYRDYCEKVSAPNNVPQMPSAGK